MGQKGKPSLNYMTMFTFNESILFMGEGKKMGEKCQVSYQEVWEI